jgi:hypothetical protein
MTYDRDRALAYLRTADCLRDGGAIASDLQYSNLEARKAALDRIEQVCRRMLQRCDHWAFDQPTYNALVRIWKHEKELLAQDQRRAA